MHFLEKLKNILVDFHSSKNMEKRVITRKNNEKYLSRYYLFRKPVKWLPSVYLHCFHASDEDQELHDHPWSSSFSIILSGSYREEFRENGLVKSRIMKPGMINLVSGNKFHRIDLETEKVWTLFVSGPKSKNWGFWNRNTGKYVDWKTHEQNKALDDMIQRISIPRSEVA